MLDGSRPVAMPTSRTRAAGPAAGAGGAGPGAGVSPLAEMNSIKSTKLTMRMAVRAVMTAAHRPRGPTRSSKCEGCTDTGGQRRRAKAEGKGEVKGEVKGRVRGVCRDL
jgi:hypothetical protein